jgi:calcineurin-like phosphoesterase family protein
MLNSFVISDTRFGRDDMIMPELSRFLFAYSGVSVLNRTIADKIYGRLVENWNAIVGKNDTVLHLGDFACEDNGYD